MRERSKAMGVRQELVDTGLGEIEGCERPHAKDSQRGEHRCGQNIWCKGK